jgi:TatD DNase family protein
MIDMHCHLDRYPNPKLVAGKAKRAGVTIVAVTNLPSHFRDGFLHASQLPNVRLSLGLHPMLAPHSELECRLFSELLPKTSYIGEIGLDFSKEGLATREAQIESFIFVLKQVQQTGKVLSIHSRKAEHEILDHLDRLNVRAATFHWFTGDDSALKRTIEAGHYLSVNPAILRSNRGRDIVKQTPKERLLFETDGPYCKGERGPAGPWEVLRVAAQVSDLWGCSTEQVTLQANRNFRQMLVDRQGIGTV